MAAHPLTRFMAIWPSGVAEWHELPQATAEEFAAQLRLLGVRIAWTPLQAPAAAPVRPSRQERRADRRSAREQARQACVVGEVLADCGVIGDADLTDPLPL